MTESAFTVLTLTERQGELADLIRWWILEDDVTASKKGVETKRQWVERWKNTFLPAASRPDEVDLLRELGDGKTTKLQGGIMLVELLAFSPYIPIGNESEDFKKELGKCELDDDTRFEVLARVATALGFRYDYPTELKRLLKDATHDLQGGWTKTIAYAAGGGLLLALASAATATGIGAAIGAAMGLKGAAAIAAGLAFLGGGSVASGGLGMAGGFALIVATGGAAGAGVGVGSKTVLDSLTRSAVLNESAKMRVVMDEILVKHHADVRIHQEVLRKQREMIMSLHEEIDELSIGLEKARGHAQANKEQIKKFEARIEEFEGIIKVVELSASIGRKTLISSSLQPD